MGRAVAVVLLVGAFLLLAPGVAPSNVYAQETTSIEGRIRNGTPGAGLPIALPVVLEVYRFGERIQVLDTVSDADGGFSFENVPGEFGIGYIISTQYAGGFYSYERDYPLPEPAELVVYESTSDGEAVRVKAHSLVINGADADTGLMNVLALVGLENSGDRTFVPELPQAGAMMSFLRFSLPLTASEVDVQSNLRGGSILQIDRGFAMTSPVPPGSYEIAYTYQAAYEGGDLSYTQSFPFGAETFRVLILSGLGSVSGDGLEETDPAMLGDDEYIQMEARDLAVGARVDLQFSGLPQPPLWKRWQRAAAREGFVSLLIPSAFGVALLSLIGYVLLTRREPMAAVAAAPGDAAQRGTLVEAIARLDDRFHRREVEEGEYLEQRRSLKARALHGAVAHELAEPSEEPGEGKEDAR